MLIMIEYVRFNCSLIRTLIVAAIVVYMVKYIPVADATAGCMSNWISTELKIKPGPIPHIAAKNAPKKATRVSLMQVLIVSS